MKTIRLLFNDAMARAIVEGRKTVTRRPVMPGPGQRWWLKSVEQITACPTARMLTEVCGAAFEHSGGGPFTCIDAPCAPGDLLIGRECWAAIRDESEEWNESTPHGGRVEYRADHNPPMRKPGGWDDAEPGHPEMVHWRPSIHMPDWAARIRRRVVSVTVERLQDITEEDAVREGFVPMPAWTARGLLAGTWDDIYAAKGLAWNVNPWVWRIEFGPENAAP